MLNNSELHSLIQILSEEDKKFEACLQHFQKSFPKSEQFRAGSIIEYLIQQNLLNAKERLVGLYILYELYRRENVKTTPFTQLVLDLLQDSTKLTIPEQKLLSDFITSVPKIALLTVNQYVAATCKLKSIDIPMIEPYKKIHFENFPKGLGFETAALSNVLRDEEYCYSSNPVLKSAGISSQEISREELCLKEFVPNFLRPLPDLDDKIDISEPIWLTPSILYEPIWDYQSELKGVAMKAFKRALTEQEMKKLTNAIKNEPLIALEWGFTPQHLPELLSENNDLVYHLLLALNSFPQISDYYSALFNASIACPQFEIVNKLIQDVDIPIEYFQILICNCIDTCMMHKDNKNHSSRLIRIVSVFFQNLFKKDSNYSTALYRDQTLVNKVERFCIDFSSVKEAAKLHRKLKTYKANP